ncbi:MAG: hypothetical protein ACTTKX_03405 [Treponema sp.]
MPSFEELCCAFGEVTSAALTTEFAMQTRQPQSSFALFKLILVKKIKAAAFKCDSLKIAGLKSILISGALRRRN